MEFKEKYQEVVDRKNSILCAGIDPAEHGMGRGGKGLAEGTDKREWSLRYIEAVAPFCAFAKPNIQYWKQMGKEGKKGDMETLKEMAELSHSLGMVFIEDSKLADIGSTNDAGFYYAADKGVDAITFSPFAGNMAEAAKQAKDRGIGIISMCMMSNPEYKSEKNKLVDVSELPEGSYANEDIKLIDGKPHVRQYIQLAHDAKTHGLDAIVVGAPNEKKNHITEEEIKGIERYWGHNLALVPGIGAQGGEADKLLKYFQIIANVGRALMFPNGANSTPQEQAETAKQYQKMLNDLIK